MSSTIEILVIDDEPQIRKLLNITLQSNDYKVKEAFNAREGLSMAANHPPDLILLDLGLPDESGHVVLEKLREWYTKPIIILSVQSNEEDIVSALDNGANDYLVKPFAFAELLARIKTLLRRGQQREDNNIIKIADLELDLRKRRVTRAGQRIDLTAKEFALMELFMRRRGEILPRALIASQIWDMNFDSDTNVVEVAIKRLRNKVDSNFTPKLIQNIRGMGYVLEVEDE